MRWVIRYDDGSFRDSDQGSPVAIPFERRYGVLWILQGPAHDRLFNQHWYIWNMERGCWTEHDSPGLMYQLARDVEHITCVLQGATVPRADWMVCMKEMDQEARSWRPQTLT